MKKTIYSGYELQQEFISMNRDYYTTYGYDAMFEYLEDVMPDYELDVIELCGWFTEYATLEDIQQDYNVKSIEDLEENTTVLVLEDYLGNIQGYLVEVY